MSTEPVEPSKTPPNKKVPRKIEDTPTKYRASQTHECLNGWLDEQRYTFLEDIAYSVLELEYEYFRDRLLPPLRDSINIDGVISSLIAKGIIGQDGNTLTKYATKPKDSEVHEDETFKPLGEIFDNVINSAKNQDRELKETLTMRLLPTETPAAGKNNVRPDGYFLLKDADERAVKNKGIKGADSNRYWYDIAVIQEFKKRDAEKFQDDDVKKVVYGLQIMMSVDPSRRFAFGITIEDTAMRLWFCSRGLVAVSKKFDFTSNADRLVHLYLSLAFASVEEVGWDPTVKIRSWTGSDPTCHYSVGKNTYETLEVLSSSAAETIVGRGTRVYRVKDLETGKEYVLKDVWLDDDRKLEHAILEEILAAVEKKYDKGARKIVAKHLLTPVAYWCVPVNGVEDHTVDVMMRGQEPPLDDIFELVIRKLHIDDKTKSVGPSAASDNEIGREMKRHLGTPLPRDNGKERRKSHRRRHYRIVFEEVAKPIYFLEKLSDVFIVLRDAAKALRYIHGSGYVHRDISAGNLYLFNGRGLLGDLEYAKLKEDDVAHELRTGTLDFMAVEAILRGYRFQKRPTASTYQEARSSYKQQTENELSSAGSAPKDAPPFFHNDLHDLESLWWVSIWELFFYRDSSLPDDNDRAAGSRASISSQLFPRTIMINGRQQFLETKSSFDEQLEWLAKTLPLNRIKAALGLLRVLLCSQYTSFEANFPEYSFETLQGVQEEFESVFNDCVGHAGGITLKPYKTTGLRRTNVKKDADMQPVDATDKPAPQVPGPGPDLQGHDTEAGGLLPAPPESSTPSLPGKRKADDADLMPHPLFHRPHYNIYADHEPSPPVRGAGYI